MYTCLDVDIYHSKWEGEMIKSTFVAQIIVSSRFPVFIVY